MVRRLRYGLSTQDRPSSTETEDVVHAIRDAGPQIKDDTGAEVLTVS